MKMHRDNKWKLTKLKEVIGKSDDIKNEIKNQIQKVTINNIGAEVSRLNMSQAFELYKSRYHLLELKGMYNESFVNLLKRLKEGDSSMNLIITVLRADSQSFIVFTDMEYYECFGVIAENNLIGRCNER